MSRYRRTSAGLLVPVAALDGCEEGRARVRGCSEARHFPNAYTLRVGRRAFVMTAEAGAYALTGKDAALTLASNVSFPNLRAMGLPVLQDVEWEADPPVQTDGTYPGMTGWGALNAAGRLTRVTDTDFPAPTSKVLRSDFPSGYTETNGGGAPYFYHAGCTEVGIGFRFKLSDPYQPSATGNQKLVFFNWDDTHGPHIIGEVYGDTLAALEIAFFPTGGAFVDQILHSGTGVGATKTTVLKNTVYECEIYSAKHTTTSPYNGKLKWWLRPRVGAAWGASVLQGNITDLQYPANHLANLLEFYTNWNGTKIEHDFLWMQKCYAVGQ